MKDAKLFWGSVICQLSPVWSLESKSSVGLLCHLPEKSNHAACTFILLVHLCHWEVVNHGSVVLQVWCLDQQHHHPLGTVKNADSQAHPRPTQLVTLGWGLAAHFWQALQVILMPIQAWEALVLIVMRHMSCCSSLSLTLVLNGGKPGTHPTPFLMMVSHELNWRQGLAREVSSPKCCNCACSTWN